KYVSIRHGGAKLEANNEINGLTLGGVGSGTSIDYVEVFANLDDGIEWFGGAVSVKHAVVSFCGDDSFDYDQSWDGKGQFWFTLQDAESNRAGEWDGSEAADLSPQVTPIIANATFIGGGPVSNNEDNNDALRIRDDGAAKVYNSVFTGFARRAIVIDNDAAQDSYQRLVDGDIEFVNNLFNDFGAGSTFADLVTTDGGDDNILLGQLNAGTGAKADPSLGGISRTNDGGLDPRVNDGSPALGGAFLINDGFFNNVPYRGAFGNDDNWALNWTALSDNGYFGDLVTPQTSETIRIVDASINAGETLDLLAINEYFLDGYVFVEEGACLNIEPGTVIRGISTPTTGDGSSALIISKGGQIKASGTADAPIIFTSEFDMDLNSNDDLTKDDKGLWGGLILLGNGIVGVDGGVQNIEGIPSTEGRAEYGGTDNADNSGVLKYVSIRHGGAKLEANNEINGLTLGGVGSGTEIDYVEVFANLDDGIEFFGGAVSVKHAAVSFCGDDSYDYDQSWYGNGQYWFSLQDEESNRAGEWDGSEAADLSPQVTPIIANATFIGGGDVSNNEDNNDALRIRDDAAAKVYNSVFTGFARRAIVIDNDAAQDSYQRFLDGDLEFISNVFHDFGAGDTFADIVTTDGGDDNLLITHLTDNGSVLEDPNMGGISRIADGGLDPRVAFGPALNGDVTVPGGNEFFDAVTFKGAFDNDTNWALNWTALSDNGYFGDIVSGTSDPLSVVDETMAVYPNPADNFTTVSFDLESAQTLSIQVIDMMGKVVTTVSAQTFGAGTQSQEINTSDLQRGVYVVLISGNKGALAKAMLIKE
ncbi:MAG TPA: T9SS C-terminal target domain-containing protein, partial [Saprospirales bacterium]|nr:T9SS C-terminal target domain-containing protein [Saprospirales bacterium]